MGLSEDPLGYLLSLPYNPFDLDKWIKFFFKLLISHIIFCEYLITQLTRRYVGVTMWPCVSSRYLVLLFSPPWLTTHLLLHGRRIPKKISILSNDASISSSSSRRPHKIVSSAATSHNFPNISLVHNTNKFTNEPSISTWPLSHLSQFSSPAVSNSDLLRLHAYMHSVSTLCFLYIAFNDKSI